MQSWTQSTALSAHGRQGRQAWFPGEILPALLVLALALGVVLVRPPLPIDETRYLEVFRESLSGSPLLLRLLGEPYAEKTPLLFWIGRALTWLSIPPEVALRLVPALASALTVFVVARLGSRAGLALAGWVQAALLLPSLAGQFLLFDPLLALVVWCAIDAWVRRHDVAFAAWSAGALLAKGPVAFLFLIPFLWSMRPLRGARAGDGARVALALGLALVPLAAWALAAAARGGPEFADALLWERWAGRLGQRADHPRALYFYLPVALLGALPGTLLLFRRSTRSDPGRPGRPGRDVPPDWIRRLAWTLGFVLVAFTLIRGKQAHYLVPAAPALALWLAWRMERDPRALPLLRAGARIQLALLLGLAVACVLLIPHKEESFGARGRELVASGGAWLPLGLAGAAALAGLLASFRPRLSARAVLALSVASTGASLLSIHRLAGQLLYPHVLAEALATDPAVPIAFLGSSHHGIYALLASRDDLEKIASEDELEAWCRGVPGGLLLIDSGDLPAVLPAGLERVASDVVHQSEVEVWRITDGARGTRVPP